MAKRNDFITISELSNLTGVSIKSLRYYDQAGILRPANTDSVTHYRYYTCSQIPLVHLIQFYIETDIPISQLQQYVDTASGTMQIRNPLFYGLASAQQKLKKLENAIAQAQALLEELDYSDQLIRSEEPFIRDIPTKICYTLPFFCAFEPKLYYSSLKHMLMEMQQLQLPIGYETGILSFQSENQQQNYLYATVTISQRDITDDTHFIKIPTQSFHCMKGDFSMIEPKNMDAFFGKGQTPKLWMLTEVFPSEFNCNQPVFELRWSGQ